MSWGIDFKADIYLSRQDYSENVHYVQDEIDCLQQQNQEIKEQMLMMVMGGPSSVTLKDMDGDESDPVDMLHTKFSDLLRQYDENSTQIIDLCYYREYLKKKEP